MLLFIRRSVTPRGLAVRQIIKKQRRLMRPECEAGGFIDNRNTFLAKFCITGASDVDVEQVFHPNVETRDLGRLMPSSSHVQVLKQYA